MENPKKQTSPSHRRLESLDLRRSSSSLNMSTSSLRSIGQEKKGSAAVHASRRPAATVRFAPPPLPPPSSAAAAARSSRCVSSHQATAPRPATARRPASSSGRKGGASAPAGAGRGSLPGGVGAAGSSESGTKAMRRSWGWAACVDAKESDAGEPTPARTQGRSSSAPRRLPRQEKPSDKRSESKIKITSRKKANSDPPPKPDVQVSHKPGLPGARRSPSTARKASDKPATNVSMNNSARVTPPGRTTATTIGASWESLPLDLQSLGSDVMSYRDAAEVAAVEALQEASAAEALLRCLSAFASLTSAAAEQSPQETVDEFLALHGALTRSAAVLGDHRGRRAEDWLGAAVATDLAGFQLYSVPPPPSPAASPSPPATAAEEVASWLAASARELGEEARAWFLGYVERLVDGDVAGTLGQLKRVNDWLDGSGAMPRSEGVEGLRKKIFGYLLGHVESAVVALNGGVGPAAKRN